MKKILITGANSYIGTSFEKYMSHFDGYQIDTVDMIGNAWKSKDLSEYDTVFHVAGIVHQKETLKNAPLYYEVNRNLTVATAKKAKREGVRQFILLSSMSVYGMDTGVITKDTVPHPKSHYGKSKLQADEKIGQLDCETFKVAILRPPMVYGKGCKGNYQRLRSFALKSPFFPDYPNQRSMVFIDNLCEFVKNVVDEEKHGLFFPQNVENTKTSDMVREIARVHGKKIRLTGAFNFAVKAAPLRIVKKVFGDLVYDDADTIGKYDLIGSIRSTERDNTAEKPLVTILTVAYNSEKTISKTIEAVYYQTYPNIEYIIIDGASKDSTAEVARSYQKKFDSTPGRTLRVISESDKGMYDALNKGAKLASGVLVGQTNADDWYERDAVETMVKLYLKEHYDAAWGSIRVKMPTGDMIKHARIGKLWTTTGWCHPAMFSTRETLLAFPYACESMYDDFDYITAVRQAGKKIVTTDHVISNFSFGGMSTQKSLKEVRKRVDILNKVYRKYGLSRFYYLHRWAMELTKYFLG